MELADFDLELLLSQAILDHSTLGLVLVLAQLRAAGRLGLAQLSAGRLSQPKFYHYLQTGEAFHTPAEPELD